MRLKYKQNSIPVTTTTNKRIMRYKFQKLYYAIIIYNCNSYSSIASKQRINVVMTDDNLKIISIKKGMHENTIYENQQASTTILLPLQEFGDLEENTYFTLEK